jgi:hypothetical protein
MRNRQFFAVVAMLMTVAIIPVSAQDTGVLSGQVHDSSGAVIAGEGVSAINTETNFESTT